MKRTTPRLGPGSLSTRLLRLPSRAGTAFGYHAPRLRQIARWLLGSREVTNFTYDLTPLNLEYLASAVSIATGREIEEIERYLAEPAGDRDLAEHVRRRTEASRFRDVADATCRFGRRLGWYAVARALKPRVIVETGVEKGLGAVLLCSALRRNAAEGSPGRYYGTDIDPGAGYLLAAPYDELGEVLVGDSIATLERLGVTIELFVNDSDHSGDYEYREYLTVKDRLAPGAIVLSDNAHVSGSLRRFSREEGRRFLFFREDPRDHWYPGAGIGFSWGPGGR